MVNFMANRKTMQQHSHFTSKFWARFPEIIGFYSVSVAIRRVSAALISSSPALFCRALFANPRAMGAACPSSLKLARAIADLVIPPGDDSLVLERGGGTGVVTKALFDLWLNTTFVLTAQEEQMVI